MSIYKKRNRILLNEIAGKMKETLNNSNSKSQSQDFDELNFNKKSKGKIK